MKITSEIEIKDLTPEQLAECFWNLDHHEQARFFERLGCCALGTPYSKVVGSYFGLDMQMFYTSKEASGNACRVMEIIGQGGNRDYLQPYFISNQTLPVVHGITKPQ